MRKLPPHCSRMQGATRPEPLMIMTKADHMAVRGGIYWRLRDPTTPWADKVKLVRYVWCHDNVYIPNKHQVIFDIVVQAVAGRKRIPAKDAAPVWQCLHDLLHTRPCQHGPRFGERLFLKGANGQVLQDELRAHSSGGQTHCGSSELIVTCCCMILESQCLNDVFTNRFENMAQLVSSTVELCLKQLSSGGSVSEQLQNLLQVALEKFKETRWKRVNLQQVVCDQLLLPTAKFLVKVTDRKSNDLLQRAAEVLQDIMLNALFDKDLYLRYQLYVGVKITAKSEGVLPKDIENIFSTLAKFLDSKADSRTCMLKFLPRFYAEFLKTYKTDDTTVAMHFVMFLTSLMGVDLDPKGNEGQGQQKVTEEELSTIYQLLGTVVERDAYSAAVDSNKGGRQAKWFQQLASLIMAQENQTESWYGILRHLVALDHTSVDKLLTTLLTRCLFSPSKEADSRACLLSDLVDTYSQLRQLPVLIDRCLLALRTYSGSAQVSWPQLMLDRLAVAVTLLPSATCVTLWKNIIDEFVSQYRDQIEEKQVEVSVRVSGICDLLSQLLLNARLADYKIPPQVAAQVSELMIGTRDEVLKPLLKACLKTTGALTVCTLYLAWSWGELHLLLCQYTSYTRGDVLRSCAECSHSDLGLVHPQLEAEEWNSLFKTVISCGASLSLYYLELLMVQKVKALILFGGDGETPNQTSIQQSVSFLLGLTQEISEVDQWDTKINTVDKSNHQVAHWNLLCENGALLFPYCGEKDLVQFCMKLVTSVGKTFHRREISVAASGLKCSAFQEIMIVQTAITSALWCRIAELISSRKRSKPRALKKSPLANSLLRLGSETAVWMDLKNPENVTKCDTALQEVAKELSETFDPKFSKPSLTFDQAAQLEGHVKILDSLPLCHFHPTHKVQCFLALSLLAGVNQSELVSTSLKQLEAVLCGAVLRFVNIGKWLCWVMDQQSSCKAPSQVVLYDRLLAQTLKVATKDLMGMTDLKPFITKCAEDMMLVSKMSLGDQERTLRTAAATLGIVRKVCERSHLMQSLEALSQQYYTMLAKPVPSLLTLLDQKLKKSSGSDQNEKMFSHVEFAYCHTLQHVCRNWWIQQKKQGAAQTGKSRKVSEAGKETEEESEEGMDVDSDVEKDEEKEEIVNEETVRVLEDIPRVCRIIAHRFSTLQLQDPAARKSTLNLVATICTNIEMTPLAERLPENFVYATWQQLLSMLQCLQSQKTEVGQGEVGQGEIGQGEVGQGEVGQGEVSQHSGSKGTAVVTGNRYLMDVEAVLRKGTERSREAEMDSSNSHDAMDETLPPGGNRIRQDLQRALTGTICALNLERFQQAVTSLIQKVSIDNTYSSPGKVVLALETMQHLLEADLSNNKYGLLRQAIQSLVVGLQGVVAECAGWDEGSDHEEILAAALLTQTKMLSHGPQLLTPTSVATCLYGLQRLPLDGSVVRFANCHRRTYEVLNEMLVQHGEATVNFIPPYISAVQRLLKSIIMQGDQVRCAQLSDAEVELLVDAALATAKLLTLLGTYREEFSKVMPYLVAEYVHHLQKVTMLPKIKSSLIGGVHKVLDLCDEHGIAMLHTVLPPGVKELFKALYTDYTKYYKYSGRV